MVGGLNGMFIETGGKFHVRFLVLGNELFCSLDGSEFRPNKMHKRLDEINFNNKTELKLLLSDQKVFRIINSQLVKKHLISRMRRTTTFVDVNGRNLSVA